MLLRWPDDDHDEQILHVGLRKLYVLPTCGRHRQLLLFHRPSRFQARGRDAAAGQEDERDVSAQQRRSESNVGRSSRGKNCHHQRHAVASCLDSVHGVLFDGHLGWSVGHHAASVGNAKLAGQDVVRLQSHHLLPIPSEISRGISTTIYRRQFAHVEYLWEKSINQ